MRKRSLRDEVLAVLKRNGSGHDGPPTPMRQRHVLYDLNGWRAARRKPLVTNEQLSRALSELKAGNKVSRIAWATPNTGNLWAIATHNE